MNRHGFTIVELLIVIVVIAILAAISIVAYNGVQSRTNDSAVKSDLAQFAKLMTLQRVDLGTYPATLTQSMGIKATKSAYGTDAQGANFRYCLNSSTDSYVLLANSKSGKYFMTLNSRNVEETAATYGWGVCGHVGLSSTNPAQNGYLSGTWASWLVD